MDGNHNTVLSLSSSSCNEGSALNGTYHPVTNGINRLAEPDAPKLLVWSAADEAGIPRVQNVWSSFFSTESIDDKKAFLQNAAYTLGTRRTHLPWRTFAVARPSDDLGTLADRFGPTCQSRESPNLAMIFSGVSTFYS